MKNLISKTIILCCISSIGCNNYFLINNNKIQKAKGSQKQEFRPVDNIVNNSVDPYYYKCPEKFYKIQTNLNVPTDSIEFKLLVKKLVLNNIDSSKISNFKIENFKIILNDTAVNRPESTKTMFYIGGNFLLDKEKYSFSGAYYPLVNKNIIVIHKCTGRPKF